MVTVQPFKGLRPIPEKANELAAPPYDVLSSEEAREKAKNNPYSFLHVVKPEIDLDPSIDVHDTQVYNKGAENLNRLIEDGIMVQDQRPCFYIYKLRMGYREQIGLVAAASVDEYDQNKIKKHEFTRPDKEQDRVNHINHLNAQTGPVFLTFRADENIDALLAEGMKHEPIYNFIGDYEVHHTFYVIDDDPLIKKIEEAFNNIDALYVADGHHRSAAASRVKEARSKSNPNHTGEEEYNFFLTVIFPHTQMLILDYNRVVKDLQGKSNEEFLEELSDNFECKLISQYEENKDVRGQKAYRPETMHTFGMYLDKNWYCLTTKMGTFNASDPIEQLDVSILQKNLLTPILSIKDPRTDERIQFVGGIRGLAELEKLVDSGKYAVAFSMFPTSIEQLLSVADANKVMPPKSTWFEPKLRSGLVVHLLD